MNLYSGSDDFSIDCDGAWLRAHCRDGATVLQIGGEIDVQNTDRISNYLQLYAAAAAAVIVDMSAVDFLSVKGLRVLMALGDECRDCGIEWALIASRSVRLMSRAAGADDAFPLMDSVSAALQRVTIATIGYLSGG